MDTHDATERAYKNGYVKGYEDAMATLNLSHPDTSKRGAKYRALMDEARHYVTVSDVVKAIADELSWRVVMRVVHSLKRKRGCECNIVGLEFDEAKTENCKLDV